MNSSIKIVDIIKGSIAGLSHQLRGGKAALSCLAAGMKSLGLDLTWLDFL